MEQKSRLSGRVVVRTTSRGPALGMQEQDKSLHPDHMFLHLSAVQRAAFHTQPGVSRLLRVKA
jgi:hypothetical protein